MGEQAKRDLELLRKARYEVQKLEEIHDKIRKEEQEIREYEEEKQKGLECEKRYTCNEEDMKIEFLKENKKKREDVQMIPLMIYMGLLFLLLIVSFFVIDSKMLNVNGNIEWFWVGNIEVLFVLLIIPFCLGDMPEEKGDEK